MPIYGIGDAQNVSPLHAFFMWSSKTNDADKRFVFISILIFFSLFMWLLHKPSWGLREKNNSNLYLKSQQHTTHPKKLIPLKNAMM